jgi:hypothetical protein
MYAEEATVKPVPIRVVRVGLGVLLGLVSVVLPSATAQASQPAAPARGVITPNSVASRLYAQAPGFLDGTPGDVWEYSGTPMNWWKDGGPAYVIYGGGSGLFAKSYPDFYRLWRYSGRPMDWQLVDDDAGNNVVVTTDSIYKQIDFGVYEYTGLPSQWIKIGNPAGKIYGGGTTLRHSE